MLAQDAQPKAGLAANLVSTLRSFLPMASKPDLNPAAGRKPIVKVCLKYRVQPQLLVNHEPTHISPGIPRERCCILASKGYWTAVVKH